jgi:hypothetical protein
LHHGLVFWVTYSGVGIVGRKRKEKREEGRKERAAAQQHFHTIFQPSVSLYFFWPGPAAVAAAAADAAAVFPSSFARMLRESAPFDFGTADSAALTAALTAWFFTA